MKFGDRLFNEAIPEWRPAYVNYKRLKKLIKAIGKKYPRAVRDLHPEVAADIPVSFDQTDEEEMERLEAIKTSDEEKAFLDAANAELEKVNDFFQEQLKITRKTHDDLEAQLAALYVAHITGGEHEVAALRDKGARQRARAIIRSEQPSLRDTLTRIFRNPSRMLQSRTKQLERVFQEYYRNLDMLRTYRDLNNTAFYKIMKKHDKITGLSLSPVILAKVCGQQKKDGVIGCWVVCRSIRLHPSA